ncbi:acylneuraminate cytidylyltransferase family protein [Prochlorococcus sp. AH-716-G10]|nr:acylneuraminate cytidylyltransferase family protein [Prochlorococcus sp. AH-716-G10]
MDCLIPARGGSKGIPNKNIIELNGIPLIAYTVHVAKKSNLINKVFVSTDSQEIAEIAKSFGATIPFIRPSYLASDNASDIEVFKHFIDEAEKLGIQISNNIVHLRPTTPGRDINEVDRAIREFEKFPEATSLRSAHISNAIPQKWFKEDNDFFIPLIDSASNFEIQNMPRQNFPITFIPNGYVDIVRANLIKTFNIFHGKKIKAYKTKLTIDIDDFKDLQLATNDPLVLGLSKEI